MNPLVGIFYHAVGGFAAGSFYIPYKRVQNWAWEVYWLSGGFFAWIVMPVLVSILAVPQVFEFLSKIPLKMMVWPYIFGFLWGIGGLTFGLTMRYLGMSLGMAIALGLTATFGTLVPPAYFGRFGELLAHTSGLVTLGGVAVCLVGIALTGRAGMIKDKEQSEEIKKGHIEEFNFKKGMLVALLAGVMSACFAFGIAAGKPIAQMAIENGAPVLYSNSPSYIFIMAGGFSTNLIWCLFLGIKNRTIGDFIKRKNTPVFINYLFSALAGITWYFQFMFYGMGTIQMGEYDFASWTIHMAFIITFSNMWGLVLKEWKGSSNRVIRAIVLGLLTLVVSTVIIGIGNYIQLFE